MKRTRPRRTPNRRGLRGYARNTPRRRGAGGGRRAANGVRCEPGPHPAVSVAAAVVTTSCARLRAERRANTALTRPRDRFTHQRVTSRPRRDGPIRRARRARVHPTRIRPMLRGPMGERRDRQVRGAGQFARGRDHATQPDVARRAPGLHAVAARRDAPGLCALVPVAQRPLVEPEAHPPAPSRPQRELACALERARRLTDGRADVGQPEVQLGDLGAGAPAGVADLHAHRGRVPAPLSDPQPAVGERWCTTAHGRRVGRRETALVVVAVADEHALACA